MWPLIHREMLSLSRQGWTYWLRVLAAGALLVALANWGTTMGIQASSGAAVFTMLNGLLLLGLAVAAPLMTADCIARERREETLGLLFLTPLRPTSVVVAKALAHWLRALLLLLGALPILTVPLLVGGVAWQSVVVALLLNFTVICLGVAAGILVSAHGKSSGRVAFVALVNAAVFYFVGCVLFLVFLHLQVFWFFGLSLDGLGQLLRMAVEELFVMLYPNLGGRGFGRGGFSSDQVLVASGAIAVTSFLLLLLALWIAGRIVRHTWQAKPRTPAQVKRQEQISRPLPLWDRAYRRWLRRHLQRNPVGWLERRSVSGRLLVTTWGAVLAAIWCWIFVDRYTLDLEMIEGIGWLIAVHVAVIAAGSFRRERETGALELLLVTPLSERQIVGGRLRGLWGQLLPLVVLLVGLWGWRSLLVPFQQEMRFDWPRDWSLAMPLLAMAAWPVIGLYWSLRSRHYLTALLATFASGIGVPWLVAWLGELITPGSGFLDEPPEIIWSLTQTFLALLCAGLLRRRLQRRAFAFHA